MACDKEITPEDFFRKCLRKDSTTGTYALAINRVATSAANSTIINCDTGKGITWRDICMLVYNETKEAINIIEMT